MIFVDVDGTLVDFNDEPIVPVVAAVWVVIAKGIHPVTIWSGGGDTYAQMWARRLFFGQDLAAIAKGPNLLQSGDTAVDDGLLFRAPAGCGVMEPLEFASWVLEPE